MSIDRQGTPIEERQATPRELRVLQLICQGLSTKQIADLLGVSYKTVACHRMHLMRKAGVHESISLFRWAIEQGHVTLDDVLPHQLSQEGATARSARRHR
jgi:DNA-binding NarL/FixJ family response regulator